MGLEWLSPGWLLLLVLVPVALFLPRLSGATRTKDLVHWALRAACFVALVLVLTRPVWVNDEEDATFVFVVDASESLVPGMNALVTEELATALETRGENARVVGWGERPELLADDERVTWLDGENADLEPALEAALAAIPAGAPGRVTAWTDGVSRREISDRIVSAYQLRDIALDVALLEERRDDLAVVDLWPAETLRVGHVGKVAARLTGFGTVNVELTADGTSWATLADVVVDGVRDVELEVEPEAAGFAACELAIEVIDGDNTVAANDKRTKTLPVQDPLEVLVLSERLAGSVDQLQNLVGDGVKLHPANPESIQPENYDLVVLDDVRAEVLPEEQQQSIIDSVETRGTGLVVAGGEAAFGPGGYHDTLVDTVLPVDSIQKEEKRDPSTTLVVIIDTSGSMGGNRVQLAKEVSRLAIRRLLPHDKVGIVEFYGAKRWAAPIQPASNSIEIQRALNRLDAGGGTVILPAIEEAFYGLQNVETRYKHVLVLTDGGVETGPFESLVRKMAAKGMNVSTVLVGPDAHSEFLVNIANWGKGRFYSVTNRFNLPEVLLKQPTSARIPAWRPGVHSVRTRGGRGWWGAAEPSEVPPLAGYTETKVRPGALVLVETEKASHPVVASWQYGAGRVSTIATELTGAATDGWNEWDGYGAFVARLLARTAQPDQGPFRYTLTRDGHEVVLRAVRTERSERLPAVVDVTDAGREVSFSERAPGTFVARWVTDPANEVRLAAGSDRPRRLVLAPYSDLHDELATDPSDAIDHERLAAATGGRSLAAQEAWTTAPTGGSRARSVTDLRPWFLALALLTYLVDVFWRRRPRSSRSPASISS